MKIALALAALIGAALTLALIAYFGLSDVLRSLAAVGWDGLLLVCAAQLALIPLLGAAWAVLTPRPPVPWRAMLIGRLVRDAATEVLPFSPVGGFVVGARAAIVSGAPASLVLATGAVDVAMEFAAQIAYAGLGLSLLWTRGRAAEGLPLLPLSAGLLVAAGLALGFVFTQRFALRPLTEQMAKRIPLGFLASADAFHEVIAAVYRRPMRLAMAIGLHLCGWIASAGGAWLILRLLGHPIGLAPLLAMESLLYAVRSAAFMVPGGLGVQEGAYALLGPMFGVPAEVALALSLCKRARDVAIGGVVLAIWQLVESRRLAINARRTRPSEGRLELRG